MNSFNFQNKKIEKVYDYTVKTFFLDYQSISSESFYEASSKLDRFYKQILPNLEKLKSYHIQIHVNNEEELEYEDLFTLFNTFAYNLYMSSIGINEKGYLKAPERLEKRMMATNYVMIQIMNHNFEFGNIQMTIYTKDGYAHQWIN